MMARVGALGLSLVFLAATANAAAGQSYFYYYFDQPQPLTVDATRVAVLNTGGAAPRGDSTPYAFGRWFTVPVEAGQRSGIESVVSATADQPGAEFASPVFFDARGLPVLITPDLLVKFNAGVTPEQAEAILEAAGVGEITDRDLHGMPGVYRIRSAKRDGFEVLADANTLAQMPETEFAEPDKVVTGTVDFIPNDPLWSFLWGLHQANDQDMDAPEAWDIQQGDPNIVVVVMDLGIQFNHPDLNLRAGSDFTGRNVANGGPFNACDNHGTMVAGTISGRINNGLGIVGVAPGCRTASAKIGEATDTTQPCTGTSFSSQETMLTAALSWAGTIGARVTNSSFSYGGSSAVTNAYTNARNNGIVHFAATGNEGASSISYPASLGVVNAVGALSSSGLRWSSSNYGTGIAFSAPGSNIYTTDRTGSAGDYSGDYTSGVSGTSFASPYAAGVAALVLSMNPALTPTNVETILQQTCVDKGTAGYDTTYGYGFVNAANAVGSLTNPPGPFNLQTPIQAETGISVNPAFAWSASPNATTYTLVVDLDPSLNSRDKLEFTELTATNLSLPGNPLRQETTYYWKVTAYNLAGAVVGTPASRSFVTLRDCNGNGLHDAAEISANPALDCNQNGWLDSCDVNGRAFASYSAYLSPFDKDNPQSYTLVSPPDAASNVTLAFEAFGDFNFFNESVAVTLNGAPLGTLFQTGADCVWLSESLTNVTAADFNTAKAGGNAVITLTPSVGVDPNTCPEGSFVRVTVTYAAAPSAPDCNTNGVPDACDLASGTSQDANGNLVPDECDGCKADANCDMVVSWRDIDFFIAGLNDNQAAWAALFGGGGPSCPFENLDVNGDAHVTWRDIDPFIARLNTVCGQ